MIDRPLFLSAVALIVIGMIFSYSLSAYAVLMYDVSPYHFLLRQGVAGVIGIAFMWLIARSDPKRWASRIGLILFFIATLLMIAIPFLPETIAHEVGGARRWIRVGPLSIAPVEFFKVGFVFFLAWSFKRRVLAAHLARDRTKRYPLKEEFMLLLPYLILFGLAMFIIAYFQNDLGQVVVLGATLLFMAIFAGSSIRFFMAAMLVTGVAIVGFIVTSPHRIERFKGWFIMMQNLLAKLFPQWAHLVVSGNPSEEPYQISTSLHAIHHGGLFGVGLGNGVLKLGFLSEVHTDFVLAGMAEEIGVVGVVAVSMLLFSVIFRLLKIANHVKEPLYYLYCTGLAMIVGFAFAINALGISGVIPLKGIAVPFLSYGGSQVVGLSIGVGLALSMSKEAK